MMTVDRPGGLVMECLQKWLLMSDDNCSNADQLLTAAPLRMYQSGYDDAHAAVVEAVVLQQGQLQVVYVNVSTLVTCGYDNAASYYPGERIEIGSQGISRESSSRQCEFGCVVPGGRCEMELVDFDADCTQSKPTYLVVKLLLQPGSEQ